jgi:hypothetical protein
MDFAYWLLRKIFPEYTYWLRSRGVNAKAKAQDKDGMFFGILAMLPAMLLDGSPETALAAHIIINCIFIHYFKEVDYEVEPLDCGDDFGVIAERDTVKVDELVALLLRYGYTLKVEEYCDEMNHIVFCQCSPITLGSRVTMIRGLPCL